ncbi:MAG: hypothetical protein Q8P49_02570 [Candidatus Liptonbacteria bacterium]|nr:hypothetical protein [Candidatus Liptonbacteria bacterium]
MKFEKIPQSEESWPEDLLGSREVSIPEELKVPEMRGERFSHEEARLEANMIRVKLKEALKHEPTAEDYDKALAMIEEMKIEALTEPESDEADQTIFRLMQIGQKYFDKGVEGLVRLLSFGLAKGDPNFAKRRAEIWDDAETKLNRLKEEAEKLD